MELLGLGVGAVENGVHLANAHVHRAYKQEQEGAHGPGNPEPIVLIQLEDADYEDRDRDGEVDRAEYVAVDAGLLSKPNQLLPQQQFLAGLGVDEVLQAEGSDSPTIFGIDPLQIPRWEVKRQSSPILVAAETPRSLHAATCPG